MDVIRRVVILGRVQGVGFRAWIQRLALECGLQGWVHNGRDGSVEALFQGPPAVVFAAIEKCRQGPSGARVESINHRDAEPDGLAERLGERFVIL